MTNTSNPANSGNTNRLNAYCTYLLSALLLAPICTAAFAHGDIAAAHKTARTSKEQKPWGIAGDAKAVTRTVTLNMNDNMRFTPDRLTFRQGETVRFIVTNHGNQMHEMVIGTRKELQAHAAMMLKFPAMEHDEPYMAHVGAGKSGGMVWTFNRAGEFDFACLIAGHYQAGMMGKIIVSAAH